MLSLSVIIPTLNEAGSIKKLLDVIQLFDDITEIIVVDGGSVDNTVEIAKAAQVKVITAAARGRGAQLRSGAQLATGDVLWFLHADTIPTLEAGGQIMKALEDARVVGGNLTIAFDGDKWAARFLTWLYPQLRKLGLFYGDSAIFIRHETYQRIGGFELFPIFEDLDLAVKMKQIGRTINLPAKVVASSRRFENRSFILVFARWATLQILYWIGVNPHFLGKLYLPFSIKNNENKSRKSNS